MKLTVLTLITKNVNLPQSETSSLKIPTLITEDVKDL